jgi:hypothetical protein
MSRMSMSPFSTLKIVAEADGELGEGLGEVELRVAVLLARLVALLLVERHGRIVAGQFAEIGLQRPDDVLGDVVADIHLRQLAGFRIAQDDDLLHR